MDLPEALQAICQPIRATDLPHSLDHMHSLLDALGSPQQAFPSVVVAGSVGKGTTCHQIAALLNNNLKVGLYTSPHIHRFRERFAINGELISKSNFIRGVEVVQQAVIKLGSQYSMFEMATALALWWFRQQAVDIAVLEIGIGGRYDAVNVVANKLAVILPIEHEHTAMLGGTLVSVATHKAGIIQPQGYAIAAPQTPEVADVLQHEAAKQQAEITFKPVGTLALAACANLMQRRIVPIFPLPEIPPVVHLPGRMEKIRFVNKTLLIDGAHTPSSARHLRAVIDRMSSGKPVRMIVGMLRDKSAKAFLTSFDDSQFHITLTQPSNHRALSPQALQHSASLELAQITIQPDLKTGIDQALQASEQLIVITGSLRMAGLTRETLGLLDAAELEEAQLTRTIFEGADYLKRLG